MSKSNPFFFGIINKLDDGSTYWTLAFATLQNAVDAVFELERNLIVPSKWDFLKLRVNCAYATDQDKPRRSGRAEDRYVYGVDLISSDLDRQKNFSGKKNWRPLSFGIDVPCETLRDFRRWGYEGEDYDRLIEQAHELADESDYCCTPPLDGKALFASRCFVLVDVETAACEIVANSSFWQLSQRLELAVSLGSIWREQPLYALLEANNILLYEFESYEEMKLFRLKFLRHQGRLQACRGNKMAFRLALETPLIEKNVPAKDVGPCETAPHVPEPLEEPPAYPPAEIEPAEPPKNILNRLLGR